MIKIDNKMRYVARLFCVVFAIIPKPLEDADSEVSPDARTRRNMMRMVIPFSNVTTQY